MTKEPSIIEAIKKHPKTDPQDTFKIDANGKSLKANFIFDRFTLPTVADGSAKDVLGVAVLWDKSTMVSYAILLYTEYGLQLLLSNNDQKSINGDLSRSQIANILYSLTDDAGLEDIHVSVYNKADDPQLKKIDKIDDEWYTTFRSYSVDYFAEIIPDDTNNDDELDANKCVKCGGDEKGKRCTTYSWKCLK